VPLPGLSADLWPLLARAAAPARLALVGGAVRDLLLHREHRDPWRGLMDLDLVVEAEAGTSPSPAEQLLRALKDTAGVRVRSATPHGRFGTVEVDLQVECQELLLDLASARRESYPSPAANPEVRFGCLEEDLARRDFSINAMALLLDPAGGEPQLLDPHGGAPDLQRRELRFLHEGSLRDDPTRLVRAARYAARLGFRLEEGSCQQVARTIAAWPWPWRPGDPPEQAPPALSTRLRMELELLLEREPWPEALAHLQSWGGFTLLDSSLQADRHWLRRLRWADRLALPRLPALLAGASDPDGLAHRLQLPHGQRQLLQRWLGLRERLDHLEAWPVGAAGWTHWLEQAGLSADGVALALATASGPRRPLLRWWLRWRHLRAPLSAAELMAQEGLQPGPRLGERLRHLRTERLRREPL
jgi:poly(A) polymerase